MTRKFLIFIGAMALIAATYMAVSFYTFPRSLDRSFETPLDALMPFLPWTVVFYVTLYFFWLPPIFSKNINERDYLRIVSAVGISFAIALMLHMIIPAAYIRPEISSVAAEGSWSLSLLKKVYSVDLPNNTFPSTHVVVVATLILMTAPYFKKWNHRFYSSWGSLIGISTLTAKEHYFFDFVGGILVAVAVSWAVKKYWPEAVKQIDRVIG